MRGRIVTCHRLSRTPLLCRVRSWPRAVNARTTTGCRCGSCDRPAGRCRSTSRCGSGISMLDSCARPDLVTEITLQPVRRYGVDAAIFYSDIMVPLKAAGVDLDIVPGTGPVIAEPIRTAADLERVRPLSTDQIPYVTEAVRRLVAELGERPLIGFAGAPFTLASYLVEGGPSKDYARTKALDGVAAGRLARALRAARADLGDLPDRSDRGRGRRGPAVRLLGGQPQRRRLHDVRPAALGPRARGDRAARGAADPLRGRHRRAAATDGRGRRRRRRGRLADSAGRGGPSARSPVRGAGQPRSGPARGAVAGGGRADPRGDHAGASAPGHVFNLGHGVPPDTDPAVLQRIVDLVHEEGVDLRRAARA